MSEEAPPAVIITCPLCDEVLFTSARRADPGTETRVLNDHIYPPAWLHTCTKEEVPCSPPTAPGP